MCCLSSTQLGCQGLSLWDGKWKHDLFSCLLLHCWQPQACVWPETALSSWWPFLDVSSLLTAHQVEADSCKEGNTAPVSSPFPPVSLPSKCQLCLGWLSPRSCGHSEGCAGLCAACMWNTVTFSSVWKQDGVLASSETSRKLVLEGMHHLLSVVLYAFLGWLG